METTTPRLLTVVEAAEQLGLSRSKFYELLANGALPSIRIGRTRRIDPSDLATFVASCREDSLSGAA